MKTIYTFILGCIAFFMLGSTANAQFSVVLFEDFEDTSIPTGWTRTQAVGSNGWEFGISSYTSGYWAIPAHPDGGMFTAANDDNCNCDASADALYTPITDWTPYDSVLVLFDAFYDAAWGGDAVAEISWDGGSNWTTYGIPDNAAWQEGLGVVLDPTIDGAFTTNMVVRFVYDDVGGWSDGYAIDNVAILGYHDVCGDIVTIPGCEQPMSVSLEGPGDLFWDFDECWATPGWEQLYQFTAPIAGTYNIEVTSSNGEWVDYLWKPVSMGCDTGNWSCIYDVANTGIWGGFYLTAGQSVYIVADAEDYVLTEQTFQVVCPCSSPISLPSGTPENEICLTDSNTDGCNLNTPSFGSLSCGETIIGNVYADNGTRDTDWFEFTVNATTDVTLSAMADFATNLVIFDNCTDLNDLAFGQAAACEEVSLTTNLGPGTYLALVSPVGFDGYTCGGGFNNYWINLDLGTPSVSINPGTTVTVCEGETTTLTANPSGGTAPYSYLWDNAATTQAITTGVGISCVTVTDANLCTADACDTVVEASVLADFTFTQSGLTGSFTDGSAPTPDAWYWDFDDNSAFSTIQNPSHNFSAPGTYIVALIAGVNPGCNDTAAYLVNVSSSGCVAQFYLGPDAEDHLNGFSLNTHDNTGDGFTDYVAYTDNTGSPVTVLNRGQSYTLTFSGSGTDYETFGAWIDYNQNGTFEAGELLGECSSSGGTCTINFTVPANATLGNSTIRLIAQEDVSSSLDPCYNTYVYGETEDYTVQIDNVVGTEEIELTSFEVYPNPAENIININFETVETGYLEVRLINSIGQVVRMDTRDYFNGVYNSSFDLSDLATGNYMLQIMTQKGMVNQKVIVK